MGYNSTIPLDTISESQAGKAALANAILAALSSAALYGVHASLSGGLTLVLYGGNVMISGTPTAIADQTVTLTASTTNYVYADSSGVVHNTTSIPSGWPGPLAAGAMALYQIVTGSSTITSGTCYIPAFGAAGPVGATGATGATGSDFSVTRKHLVGAIGSTSTSVSVLGVGTITLTGATNTARTQASTSWREAIPYVGYESGSSAGSSAQVWNGNTYAYLGNAAGRGGFTLAIRMCFENAFISQPANARCFFGLFPGSTIGNVEPDTLLNMVGFGAKAGDANLSFMHNDGTGTATLVALGSNFPANPTNNVYEMLLQSNANSGIVTYQITDTATGNVASGSASSDLPSNTTFLTWVMWVNNGATAAKASFGFMQLDAETRY